MSEITVTLLTAAQARVLDTVAADVFDNEVDPELAAQFLASDSNLLVVARDGGVVVGMASGLVYVHPDKPLALFVNEVGVAPSHQRRGIGRRLMKTLLDAARARGCVEAWVATETDNVAARGLYTDLGGIEDASPAVVYTFRP